MEMTSSEEEEEGMSQAQAMHKIPRRPLMVPQRFKTEPSDFAVGMTMLHDDEPAQRFASRPAHIKSKPLVIDLTISDQEDGTAPVTTARKRARSAYSSTSRSASSPSPSLGHITDSIDEDEAAWPSDFYVVDIVHCFKKCKAARRNRTSVEDAFLKCFKVPFRSMTFYNHHRHWENAPEACRNEALRAGRSATGSWKVFLKHMSLTARERRIRRARFESMFYFFLH